MKDFLEDCYSLKCLAPHTERSYLDLDNSAFIYSCMITDDISIITSKKISQY